MNPLADQILADLRECKTEADIQLTASKHRSEVMAMQATDKPRYLHIVNAKSYYLERLRNGQA